MRGLPLAPSGTPAEAPRCESLRKETARERSRG